MQSEIRFVPLRQQTARKRLVLLRLPFFSPISPSLALGMLKSFLERNGHSVTSIDLNVDPVLWTTQRRYFATLEAIDGKKSRDGHSKLWALINAHMHLYLNGENGERAARLISAISALFGMQVSVRQAIGLTPIVDGFFARLQQCLEQVEFTEADFVGASTYTTSLAPTLYALRYIKHRYPKCRTVMGGGVFADDLALGSENLETLLRECPYVDHVVLGEGELLLLRLIEGALGHRRVVTLSELGRESLDIGSLPPPDFSDIDLSKYFYLTLEGGRSCPFQCSFCSETIQWGEYRKKGKQYLADQMIGLSERYGNRRFFMGDSLVNPYINGLAAELVNRRAGLAFDGYLRADKAASDAERGQLWARAGLYRARLGLETASKHMLEVMDKRITPQSMLEVLKNLAAHGIRTTTYWVVGFPGETEKDFEETLDFVEEAYPHIYELEAHPYYYYPYGQVTSRLFKGVSIYPQELVEIIKFKVWEVEDAQPSREEKFDRLRRFSDLASHLGIPNIYSMVEQYEAEKRWRELTAVPETR